MKKIAWKRALALSALLAMLLSALCACAEITVASFTVDQLVAGNDYLFAVLKQGAKANGFEEGDVLFMDQITATGKTAHVAVMLESFDGCVAVAGGEFSGNAGSPRQLGSYTATRLPEQLEAVGKAAFEGAAFTHVYLGEMVKSIGARAFAECADLAYIYIPDSVKSIAADAFSGSKNVVIGCTKGSAAHKLAESAGIPYQLLD